MAQTYRTQMSVAEIVGRVKSHDIDGVLRSIDDPIERMDARRAFESGGRWVPITTPGREPVDTRDSAFEDIVNTLALVDEELASDFNACFDTLKDPSTWEGSFREALTAYRNRGADAPVEVPSDDPVVVIDLAQRRATEAGHPTMAAQ